MLTGRDVLKDTTLSSTCFWWSHFVIQVPVLQLILHCNLSIIFFMCAICIQSVNLDQNKAQLNEDSRKDILHTHLKCIWWFISIKRSGKRGNIPIAVGPIRISLVLPNAVKLLATLCYTSPLLSFGSFVTLLQFPVVVPYSGYGSVLSGNLKFLALRTSVHDWSTLVSHCACVSRCSLSLRCPALVHWNHGLCNVCMLSMHRFRLPLQLLQAFLQQLGTAR